LAANADAVAGIKLQASVLANHEVLSGLRRHGLGGKVLMINVSGHSLDAVRELVESFRPLRADRLLLQAGHQAYPTPVAEAGLAKIAVLRRAFPDMDLAIADHVA